MGNTPNTHWIHKQTNILHWGQPPIPQLPNHHNCTQKTSYTMGNIPNTHKSTSILHYKPAYFTEGNPHLNFTWTPIHHNCTQKTRLTVDNTQHNQITAGEMQSQLAYLHWLSYGFLKDLGHLLNKVLGNDILGKISSERKQRHLEKVILLLLPRIQNNNNVVGKGSPLCLLTSLPQKMLMALFGSIIGICRWAEQRPFFPWHHGALCTKVLSWVATFISEMMGEWTLSYCCSLTHIITATHR